MGPSDPSSSMATSSGNAPDTSRPPIANPGSSFWAKAMGPLAFAAAGASLFLCVSRWDGWTGALRHQRTDDAYLEADLTPIASRVSGYVRRVPTQDFQTVRAGQLLVQIDDEDYRAAADQDDANVAVARAAIQNLIAQGVLQRANVRAAVATVAASTAIAERMTKAARRQHVLLEGGAGSQDQTEAADAANLSSAAQLARDEAQAEANRQQIAVIATQVRQARASLAASQAAAEIARNNLRHTRILAPQDGVLGQRNVQPGQYVGIGGQVTTLSPLPHVWVIANFKETQLTRMGIGQAATITVDAYSGRLLRGHVAGFAPASGARYALLPPDNATGNFTKIVQRVAVKIVIDDSNGIGVLLRPGMSVIADVDTAPR